MIQETFGSIDPILASAVAVGLAAFVVTMLVINRDGRLEINVDALVLGEPGAFGVGIALVIAAASMSGMASVVRLIGVVLMVAAVLSWTTDTIEF